MTRRPIDWRAVSIFAVAAGVRLVYALEYAASPLAGIELADQSYYRNWAMNIVAGDWLGTTVFEQGPLYAYLLAGAFLSGLPDALILAAQMLLGAGTCVLVYFCGRRLFDSHTAVLAGALAALYGPFVFYECMMMKSFLSPLFTLVVLYAGLRYSDRYRPAWLIVAGGAIGLACLNREIYALLLVPAVLWTWSVSKTAPQFPLRRRWQHLALLVLSGAVVILPATFRNRVAAGELVAVTSGGGEVFYMAHGPYATGNYEPPPFVRGNPFLEHEDFRKEAQARTGRPLTSGESSRYWFREGARHVLNQPRRAIQLTAVKAVNLFNDFEVPDSQNFEVTRELIPALSFLPTFGWLVGPGFLGIGLCLANVKRYQLPLGITAAHVAGVLLSYNFGRFRIGMVPVWILFAAYGFSWLVTGWRDVGRAARLKWLTGAAAVALITLAAYRPQWGVDDARLAAEKHKLRQTLAHMSQLRSTASRLQEQLAVEPHNAQAHRSLGEQLLLLRRFHEAHRHSAEAVRLEPDEPRSHLLLGDSLDRLKRYEEAAGQYQRSLTLGGDEAEARARLGALAVNLERYEQTVPHLRAVARLQPASANARINLGFVCAKLCQPPLGRADQRADESEWCSEAVAQFEEALRLEPDNRQASQELGQLLFRLGRFRQTVELLESASHNQPDHFELEPLFDRLLAETQGTLDDSQTARLAEALDRLAAAAAERSRFDVAIRLQRKAVTAAEAARRPNLVQTFNLRLRNFESHPSDSSSRR